MQKYLVLGNGRDSSLDIPNEGQIWLQLSLEKLWSPEILMLRQSLWLLNGFQRVSFLPWDRAQPWDRAMAELKGYFALIQGQIHILWLCLEPPFKWDPCKLQENEGRGEIKKKKMKYTLLFGHWNIHLQKGSARLSRGEHRGSSSVWKKKRGWKKKKCKKPWTLEPLTQAPAPLPSSHKGLSIICQIILLWCSPQG